MKKAVKLNLGCEDKILKDFINVDLERFNGVDVVHDLNKPFKWEDNFVDYVYSAFRFDS
jgi:predicted SAM-dependent methyltransferase